MDLPPFPTTTSELDAWHVYGDWLQTTNDRAEQRRGELIARELALPAVIDKVTLREYHTAARRTCGHPRAIVIAFCLGHARTMSIIPPIAWRIRPSGPDQSALTHARDLLRKPFATRLEEFSFVYEHPSRDARKYWTRIMAAVPASCTRMGITLLQPVSQEQIDGILSIIPSFVREVSVGWTGRAGPNINIGEISHRQCLVSFLDNDRFERITLLMDLGAMPLGNAVLEQLARTKRTRLRIRSTFDLRSVKDVPRIEIGVPGADAFLSRAFLDESNLSRGADAGANASTSVVVLRRWPLVDLQQRYGIVPVRTLLAQELPERYSIHPSPPAMILIGIYDGDIARRGDVWTLRGQVNRDVRVNGVRVTEGLRVIEYGDRLSFPLTPPTVGAPSTNAEWTLTESLPAC